MWNNHKPIIKSSGQILNQRLYDACQRNGDGWYYDDQRDGGEMKRYSRDINNDVNLGTRQIIMRDGSFLSNSASIDRGFMDIQTPLLSLEVDITDFDFYIFVSKPNFTCDLVGLGSQLN